MEKFSFFLHLMLKADAGHVIALMVIEKGGKVRFDV